MYRIININNKDKLKKKKKLSKTLNLFQNALKSRKYIFLHYPKNSHTLEKK